MPKKYRNASFDPELYESMSATAAAKAQELGKRSVSIPEMVEIMHAFYVKNYKPPKPRTPDVRRIVRQG